MDINIVKIWVGWESIEDIEEWIDFRIEEKREEGIVKEKVKKKSMVKKSIDEIMEGRYI